MAQRIETTLIDDIDGSGADETVSFAIDGQQYEIDLSTEHGDELRAALEKFIANARKIGGRTGRGSRGARRQPAAAAPIPPPAPSTEVNPKEVRAWADAQGVEYNKRGRLSRELVARFLEAKQGR